MGGLRKSAGIAGWSLTVFAPLRPESLDALNIRRDHIQRCHQRLRGWIPLGGSSSAAGKSASGSTGTTAQPALSFDDSVGVTGLVGVAVGNRFGQMFEPGKGMEGKHFAWWNMVDNNASQHTSCLFLLPCGFEADVVTYGAVLSVCEKSMRWEEALAVLRPPLP